MFLKHGLKLLNLSVIFYILSGAVVFHWLGEFQPGRVDKDGRRGESPPVKPIGELRLSSVRRMWNITNQLNILYESNWTELVLAELVDFERQFVDSLEQLSSSGEAQQDSSREDQDEEKSDKDQDKRKRKNENGAASSKKPEAKSWHKLATDERIRVESIKKSLVHSLATITTMGSPIRQPASQLGRLLTVLYGTLGIPLLLVTVAKSGQHLARSSLNGLLYIRHYCLTLPIHYLCCSCNLLVCLRLLSWCCCCCCCSYLFCLNDKRRTKCCDFGNAPRLRLHRKRKPRQRQRRSRRRHRSRGNVTKSESTSDEEQQKSPQDETASSGTYVIGFNLQQMSQNERQKSVRFNERRKNSSGSSQEEDEDDSSSSNDDDDDHEHAQDEAWRLLASSLTILLAYVMLGALYHAHQHDLPLVDALFACFSMLSTSKLPDSFQLDGANPIVLYKSRVKSKTSPKISIDARSNKLIASEDLALILDSLYLLVGLNMIAACAQFGRLWFDGTIKRKFAACPKGPASGSKTDNQSKPSLSSLTGSFERQNNQYTGQNNFTPSSEAQPARNGQPVGYQLNQFAVLSPANEATSSSPCSADLMQQKANELTAQQGGNQLGLSELFVLSPADQMSCNQIHYQQHSDGASFASSSSQTAVAPSLCVHHQKTTQNTLERHHQHRHHFHHHHQQQQQHHQQTNGLSDCSSSANTNSHLAAGPMHHSSSLMQLFDEPQINYNQNQNQDTATLTRRNQPTPLYKNGILQNGLNGSQQEPDSSPNTFDITNSQTISSSASSRAAATVIRPNRFVVSQPLSAAVAIIPANEKTVSWFEANDDNDRVKQY